MKLPDLIRSTPNNRGDGNADHAQAALPRSAAPERLPASRRTRPRKRKTASEDGSTAGRHSSALFATGNDRDFSRALPFAGHCRPGAMLLVHFSLVAAQRSVVRD